MIKVSIERLNQIKFFFWALALFLSGLLAIKLAYGYWVLSLTSLGFNIIFYSLQLYMEKKYKWNVWVFSHNTDFLISILFILVASLANTNNYQGVIV